MTAVREYLARKLEELPLDLNQQDAQVLLARALERPRSWLLAHLDAPLSPPELNAADQAFARLSAGEPLPYILGHWEFFGMDFEITPDTLIPRPETELLVESAIKWMKNNPEKRRVADIGTGSGIIAVSIAANIPDAQILAADISPVALKVARRNAEKFNVSERIEFVECDLLPKDFPSWSLHLICANLPYIPTAKLRELAVFKHEPTLALDGGEDGLDLYRRLFNIAPKYLALDGLMLLEVEAEQGIHALNLAFDSFSNASIQLRKDLADCNRLLEIKLRG
ncbi:MAG: peptide chain release factor N(5)-glutamine methyltransferase [Anaerolineales bacterium]|nr:peptide chain release factor N(5)-glutamine methyltransferase [Anaerolineales bacterium]